MLSGLLKLIWNEYQRSPAKVRIIPSPLPAGWRFSLVMAFWYLQPLDLTCSSDLINIAQHIQERFHCCYGSLNGKNKPAEVWMVKKSSMFFLEATLDKGRCTGRYFFHAYSLSNGLMAQESRPLGKGGNSLFIISWVTQRGLASFGYKSDPQRA